MRTRWVIIALTVALILSQGMPPAWARATSSSGPVALAGTSEAAGVSDDVDESGGGRGRYWQSDSDLQDRTTKPYPSFVPYSEIAGILRDIERRSPRVKVEVIGQSALGHDLFLVIVSDPSAHGRLGRYQALRHTMLRDPVKAQEMVEQGADFKVPIFINGSIHGNEEPGTDAVLRLIRTFAFEDTDEVREILENTILLFNVSANPDGRILNTRANGNGFDLNRDFVTLSQPETRAIVAQIVRWKPMVLLDLHGYVNPMLIEPATPPHNPNYEYDLYIKWALDMAIAMGERVKAHTGLDYQIPYRDREAGWDDYPPIFTPMYAMYHGAIGATLETAVRSETGVEAHYQAVMAAALFAARNKMPMFHDQIEQFKRGVLAGDNPDRYPYAYILPGGPSQAHPNQVADAVQALLDHGIEVHQSKQPFTADGVTYPAGSYVVLMNQPLRGLANTLLWKGQDISYDIPAMYDISAWNLPELWGFTRVAVEEPFEAQLVQVHKVQRPQGRVENANAAYYVIPNDNNNAIRAVNALLDRGADAWMAMEPLPGFGPGAFVVRAEGVRQVAIDLARDLGLTITGIDSTDRALKPLRRLRVAVLGPGYTSFTLRELGFDVTALSVNDVASGRLTDFDVLVNQTDSSNSAFHEAVRDFVAKGGAYVGIGAGSAALNQRLGLLPVVYNAGRRDDNGIVRVSNNAEHPVMANYPADGYSFVYYPAWFTSTGNGVEVISRFQPEDFFMAGHWRDRKDAAGSAVVVGGTYGNGRVVLFGTEPLFRAHTRALFRSVVNAIFYTVHN